jgi:hypothetical protein
VALHAGKKEQSNLPPILDAEGMQVNKPGAGRSISC